MNDENLSCSEGNIQNSPKLEFARSQKRNSSIFEERFRKDSNPRRTSDEIRAQVVFEKQIKTLQPQILMSLSLIEESKDLESCKELRKLLEYGIKELNELEKNIKEESQTNIQKSKLRWGELMTESIEKRSRSSSPKGKYSNGSPISEKYREKLNRDEWNKTGQNYQKEQKEEKKKMAIEKQKEILKKKQEENELKHKKAIENQKEHLSKVSSSAKEKNSRINEVAFIQKINDDNEKFLLSNKMKQNEETHTQRREEQLNSIKKRISVDLSTKEQKAKAKREELEIQRQNAIKEKEKQRKQKEELFQERRSSMFKFKSPQTPKSIPKRKDSILSKNSTSKKLTFNESPLLNAILLNFKTSISKLKKNEMNNNPNVPLTNLKVTRIFNDLKSGVQNDKIEDCRTALREFISLPDNKKGFEIQFFIQEQIIDYLVNLLIGTIDSMDSITSNLCSKVLLKVSIFSEGATYLVEQFLFFKLYDLSLNCISNDECATNLSNLFEIINNSIQNYNSNLKWNLIWYISESGLFDSLFKELSIIHQLDQSQSVFILKLLNLISQIIDIVEMNEMINKKEKEVLLGIIENFIGSTFGGTVNLLSQVLNDHDQKKVIPRYILSISLNLLKILNSVFYQYSLYCDEECLFIQKSLNSIIDLDKIFIVLLNHCCNHEAVVKINPSLTNLENLTDIKSILHELLLFIGYYTLNNDEGQLIFTENQKLIKWLNDLPMFYFVSEPEILFPTLISICFRNDENKTILGEDLNFSFVREFIKENDKESTSKFAFCKRFPSQFITEALQYFSEEKE
eukprot:gene219-4465_t